MRTKQRGCVRRQPRLPTFFERSLSPGLPSTLVLLAAIVILGCSDDRPEEAAAPTSSPLPPEATATAVASTATASPGVALTPRAAANVDLATAQRLESEGDLESAANAYVTIAARNDANRTD